jgi:hypothetical protein
MSRLEDLKENATVQGILPNGLVTVVNTRWHGSAALELEIDASIPGGAPDNVVRTVTENSRVLKFINQGFEESGGPTA